MIEINLPCCNAPVVIDEHAHEVLCEECGLTLELAPDARPSTWFAYAGLLAAA
jgi:hypothetical protein